MSPAEPAADPWAQLVDAFVDGHYGSVRGRVRLHVLREHLREVLAPGASVCDVGGGAGDLSLPLAHEGHPVTIVDPSPAMLQRARQRVEAAPPEVAARVRLVEAEGERAPEALGGERFGAVLSHGVLPYLDDPEPMVAALCFLAAPDGVVSIVAKNADTLALRPGLAGDWAAALDAFDQEREVNALGVDTRGDRVEHLVGLIAGHGVAPVDWYGVRLFTDWIDGAGHLADGDDVGAPDDPLLLRAELEASRRDPYRHLSRLFHLVGRRTSPP